MNRPRYARGPLVGRVDFSALYQHPSLTWDRKFATLAEADALHRRHMGICRDASRQARSAGYLPLSSAGFLLLVYLREELS